MQAQEPLRLRADGHGVGEANRLGHPVIGDDLLDQLTWVSIAESHEIVGNLHAI